MQFVTADTHFLDEHLLGIDNFAPRPFLTVDQMDQTIIKNWNERVSENDTVYHLGDIAVYFAKPQAKAYEKIFQILDSLNGHLVLIKGNHDSRGLFKYLAKNNYSFSGNQSLLFMMLAYC